MNKGFNYSKELAEQSDNDWKLGATGLTCMAEIPEEEREKYLPKGELQNIGEEKMDCVSRAVVNVLEMKFNYLIDKKKISLLNHAWLLEKGYIKDNKVEMSDAYIAILSGTTREGNSIKAPLDAARKNGMIPKSLLPQLSTFDEHHNPARITEELKALGLEFSNRFFVNYERGSESAFGELLKRDVLVSGGYAWPTAINGEYPRTELGANHAFMVYKTPKYYAFDNYEEAKGDFIKKLAENFDLLDGYRVLINKEVVTPLKKSPFQKIIEFLKDYVKEIFK